MIYPSRFPSVHLYAILISSPSTTWPTYLFLRDLNAVPALFGEGLNFTHFLKQSPPTSSYFLSLSQYILLSTLLLNTSNLYYYLQKEKSYALIKYW